MSETETTARKRRTPAEIAQTALDEAAKRHDRAVAHSSKMRERYSVAQDDVKRAKRRLDFAKSDPDLPPQAAPMPEDDEPGGDQAAPYEG